MRSMSLVVDLIDLVTKHKSGELRCRTTALIIAGFSNCTADQCLCFCFIDTTISFLPISAISKF